MNQTSTPPAPESISLDFKSDIQRLTQGFVGREWVFAEIDRWLANPRSPTFFIITGEPGIGKSAIAARLTQRRDDIGAYHFCHARRADTLDPLNLVRSLAQQLSRFEGFIRAILRESNIVVQPDIDVRENYGKVVGVRVNTLIINARSASSAFQQSVIEPLKVLASSLDHPLLIVVDSLDEAARHHGDETIVDLLANAGALPPQARFVLASRPEGEVLRHFAERNIPHVELDAKGDGNRADVAPYLDGQLAASAEMQARVRESGLTREQSDERLLQASAGNFLYLVWLLPEIALGRQSLAGQVQLPAGLDGIYREFLRTRMVGEDLRGKWRSLYRPLLGLLRVCGIELASSGDGLLITPQAPPERFVLDLHLLHLEVDPSRIAGEYRAAVDGSRVLHVRACQREQTQCHDRRASRENIAAQFPRSSAKPYIPCWAERSVRSPMECMKPGGSAIWERGELMDWHN
jgi:hypothetical protein